MRFAPCLDCPERVIGCHGQCKYYQKYRLSREIVRIKKEEEFKFNCYRNDAIDRMKSTRRKK